MSPVAVSLQSLQATYAAGVAQLTLACISLTQESATVDYDQDPSYDMYLPLDAQCSALNIIVGAGAGREA